MNENKILGSNRLPGSEKLTRPEEIKSMSKYLRAIRETYEEHTHLGTLLDEVPGVTTGKIPEVTQLSDNIEKLDSPGPQITSLGDTIINLDKKTQEVTLEDYLDTLKENPNSPTSLSQKNISIPDEGLKKNTELSSEVIKIDTPEEVNLDSSLINLDIPREETTLEDSRVKLGEITGDIKLSKTIEILDKASDNIDLENTKINLETPQDTTPLDDTLVNLKVEDFADLDNTRLDLSDTEKKIGLSKIKELLSLGDNILDLRNTKISLDTENNIKSLDETKIKLRELNENPELSTIKIDLEEKSKNIDLEDIKIKLGEPQVEISLDKTRLDIEDSQENNLSSEKIKLKKTPGEPKLSEFLGELGGNQKEVDLSETREALGGIQKDPTLEDEVILIKSTSVDSLNSTKIGLENTSELKSLEDTRVDLNPIENPELGNTKIELKDTTSKITLEDIKDQLPQRPEEIEELYDAVLGIDVDQVKELETKVEVINPWGIDSLGETRIDIEKQSDPALEETKVGMIGEIEDKDLGTTRIDIEDSRNYNLSTTQIKRPYSETSDNPTSLSDTLIKNPQNENKDIDSLDETSIGLDGVTETKSLSDTILSLKDGNFHDSFLEDTRIDIDDPRDNNLEDTRIDIEDSRENSLEDTRIDIDDPRDNNLEDTRIDIEDTRDNNLEDTRIDIEDTRDNNLEDTRIDIDDSRENSLEDTRIDIEDSRENNLGDTRIDIEDSRENSLGDTRIDIDDPRENSLGDTRIDIEDSRENSLGDFIDSLNIQQENELEDTRLDLESQDKYTDEFSKVVISPDIPKNNIDSLDSTIIEQPGEKPNINLYNNSTLQELLANLNIELEDRLIERPESLTGEPEELYDEFLELANSSSEINPELEGKAVSLLEDVNLSESKIRLHSEATSRWKLGEDQNPIQAIKDPLTKDPSTLDEYIKSLSDDEAYTKALDIAREGKNAAPEMANWFEKISSAVSSYFSSPQMSPQRAFDYMEGFSTAIKKARDEFNPNSDSTDSKYIYYQIPDYQLTKNGGVLDSLNINEYIRWLAENSVGKTLKPQVRRILLNETLAALVLARDQAEKLSRSNRDRLPGNDSGLLGTAIRAASQSGISGVIDKGVSALKTAASQLFEGGNLVDHTNPMNRPETKVDGQLKGEGIGITKYEEANNRDESSDNTGGGFFKKLAKNALGIGGGNVKTYKEKYWDAPSFRWTLRDLCPGADVTETTTLEELKSILEASPYITTPSKFSTLTKGKYKSQTLDTNTYWEIVMQPFVSPTMNGGWSYLPAFWEINLENIKLHGVNTGYSSWVPINSFELQKSKTTSKQLSLYDGEILYPVGTEFLNELRITVVDDSWKSWRRYFEKCFKASVYNSEAHYGSYYANKDITPGSTLVPTAIDETNFCIALYKNITFEFEIYIMNPQYNQIKKYHLLGVLKDFTEESIGEIDSGGTDLNVSFSIVGENPDQSALQQIKNKNTETMKKEFTAIQDQKKKNSSNSNLIKLL